MRDIWQNEVQLTEERLAHLLEHPEMSGQENKLAETLLEPDIVIQSRSDETVRLFHRFYGETSVGDKYLCVVVKYPQEAMFLLSRHISPLQLNGEEFYGKSESLV